MREIALLVAVAGCAAGPRVLARGALAYDVAAAADVVATVELETEFALVLRRPGGTVRVALGPPERDIVAVALDGAGRTAAVAGRDGMVRVHDAVTGGERARWSTGDAATAVALSGDGRYLATGAASGVLCLRRADDGALLQCVAEHARAVRALAIRGDRLASLDDGGTLLSWRLPSLALAERGHAGGAQVLALAFTPDGRLVTGRADGQVDIAGRPVASFPGAARGVAVSADGRILYVAGFTTRDLRGPSLLAFPVK